MVMCLKYNQRFVYTHCMFNMKNSLYPTTHATTVVCHEGVHGAACTY